MQRAPNTFSPASKAAALVLALSLASSLVTTWEGKSNAVYLDGGGVPTVCRGHTGPDVKMGQLPRTDAQCEALFQADMNAHGQGLLTCLRADVPTPLLAAFWSFAYNVGIGQACGSTAVRLANAESYMPACAQLSRWNRDNGRVIRGLANRRADERAVCERITRV